MHSSRVSHLLLSLLCIGLTGKYSNCDRLSSVLCNVTALSLRYRSNEQSVSLGGQLQDQPKTAGCTLPPLQQRHNYCINNFPFVSDSLGLQIFANHSCSLKLNVAVRVIGHQSRHSVHKSGQQAIFDHRSRCLIETVPPHSPVRAGHR